MVDAFQHTLFYLSALSRKKIMHVLHITHLVQCIFVIIWRYGTCNFWIVTSNYFFEKYTMKCISKSVLLVKSPLFVNNISQDLQAENFEFISFMANLKHLVKTATLDLIVYHRRDYCSKLPSLWFNKWKVNEV